MRAAKAGDKDWTNDSSLRRSGKPNFQGVLGAGPGSREGQ